MDESDLKRLLEWLDGAKKPQIVQTIKSECGKYKKEFEGIECE